VEWDPLEGWERKGRDAVEERDGKRGDGKGEERRGEEGREGKGGERKEG